MGGGVSAGAFSGGALTEAIKLALLHLAEDPEGCEYSDVEIDAFSGASAGSISLAMMLRAFAWRHPQEEKKAEANLKALYPKLSSSWSTIPEGLRLKLIAAQVAQDIQWNAWVESVDLDGLLGQKGPADKDQAEGQLRTEPSLFYREFLLEMARRQVIPDGSPKLRPTLLSTECLFGATLTGLVPFTADARRHLIDTPEEGLVGLNDALRSKVHKDMRVFHIFFRELDPAEVRTNVDDAHAIAVMAANQKDTAESAQKLDLRYPSRWYRLHNSAEVDHSCSKVNGVRACSHLHSLLDPAEWWVFVTTALASGAFPFAFPPVVLERFEHEYGAYWPHDLRDSTDQGKRDDTINLAYADGGIFNNDPIREVYRMTSFLDATERRSFLRRIIYVDPLTTDGAPSYSAKVLNELGFDEKDVTVERTSFPRLIDVTSHLVSLLVSQGRSREADQIALIRDVFEDRDKLRDRLSEIIQRATDTAWLDSLARDLFIGCSRILARRFQELIPPARAKLSLELVRAAREVRLAGTSVIAIPDDVLSIAETFPYDQPDKDWFATDDYRNHRREWCYLLLVCYVDCLLGIEGKSPDAKVIAIVQRLPTDGNIGDVIPMFTSPLSAFAGFFDQSARDHDFQAARLAARHFLGLASAGKMVPSSAWLGKINLQTLRPKYADYRANLHSGVERLFERVKEIISNASPTAGAIASIVAWWTSTLKKTLGGLDEIISTLYSKNSDRIAEHSATIRLILPPNHQDLELDTQAGEVVGGGSDGKPRRRSWKRSVMHQLNDAGMGLETLVRLDNDEQGKDQWKGAGVKDGTSLIVDRSDIKGFAKIRLPIPGSPLHRELLDQARQCLYPIWCYRVASTGGEQSPDAWTIVDGAIPTAEHPFPSADRMS